MLRALVSLVVIAGVASPTMAGQTPAAPPKTILAIFGPYRDGEIPNDEAARRYVADVIR
jgi:hypothetical protein